MSKPKKQKAPQSEKSQLRLASQMNNIGSGIQGRHMGSVISNRNYDEFSKRKAEQSASNANAIRSQSKKNKLKNRTNIGKSLVGGDIGISTIASKAGVSKSQRLARSAADAYKSGANTLKTGSYAMAIDNERQRQDVLEHNQRSQAMLDLASAGTAYGLDKKFDADKKAEEDKKNLVGMADNPNSYNYNQSQGAFSGLENPFDLPA